MTIYKYIEIYNIRVREGYLNLPKYYNIICGTFKMNPRAIVSVFTASNLDVLCE